MSDRSALEPGQWVVTYPSGREIVYSGVAARRLANREAIATGGTAQQIE